LVALPSVTRGMGSAKIVKSGAAPIDDRDHMVSDIGTLKPADMTDAMIAGEGDPTQLLVCRARRGHRRRRPTRMRSTTTPEPSESRTTVLLANAGEAVH